MSGPSNPQSRTYFHIKEGKFLTKATAFDKENPDHIQIANDKGEVKSYLAYRNFSGVITKFSTKEDDYNGTKIMKVCLDMSAGGKSYVIQISVDSPYGRAFFQQIFNVDLTKEVSIGLTYTVDGDKKNAGLFMSQDNKNVGFSFTREKPGEAPPMVPLMAGKKQAEKNGKLQWDSTERTEWFLRKLEELNATLTPAGTAALMTADEPDFDSQDDGVQGDLPF